MLFYEKIRVSHLVLYSFIRSGQGTHRMERIQTDKPPHPISNFKVQSDGPKEWETKALFIAYSLELLEVSLYELHYSSLEQVVIVSDNLLELERDVE